MPKVGDKFLGTVVKTAAFGAFIALLPGRDGLLHISKVGNGKRVERVEDFLNVGDKVEVQIADIDNRGKIYLDKVPAEGEEVPAAAAPAAEGAGRPAGRDRGDRGPRGDRGERGPGRERGERGPRNAAPAPAEAGAEGGAETGAEAPGDDTDGGDGEGGEPRRRRHRHN
jgi:polyribonucleotide nucleotidyltransferase